MTRAQMISRYGWVSLAPWRQPEPDGWPVRFRMIGRTR